MSEETEIKREELQEMARAILSKIYGAASAQNGFEGLEISPRLSRDGLGFADREIRGNGERLLSYEQVNDLKRQANIADSDEFIPRQSRGEFLEQRALRRSVREKAAGISGETAEGTIENAAVRSGSLHEADISEKLSDIFCRDARRYDGAFEKY